MTLLELKWKLFGMPDVPPKPIKIKSKINIYTGNYYMPKSYIMATHYNDGNSIEEIADRYNVTRERVRQCLWKAWRDSRK